MNITAIQTLIVSVITIVGVIVLIALHDLATSAGLPVIVALAGVHLGAAVSNPVSTSTTPVIQ